MDERKSALVRFRFQLKEHQDSKNEWMDQLFGDRSVSSFGAAFACLLPWERGRNIPKILILFFLLGDLSIVAAMFTNYHRAHSRIVKDHRQGRLERKRKKERKKERGICRVRRRYYSTIPIFVCQSIYYATNSC